MKKKVEGTTQTQEKRIQEKFRFMLNEAIPVNQEERRKYVGDVAFFYLSIFKSKLQHFHGLQLEELAQIGRSERLSDIIRANINSMRLINEWMQFCVSEHQGNLEGIRNALPDSEEFINDIKKKYG